MLILSRGKCGDLIAQVCYSRKHYQETGDKTSIYCRQHKPFKRGQLQFIEPLLKLQPYIDKIGWTNKITDIYPDIPQLQAPDVKKARELAEKYNYYSLWWVDEDIWWQQIHKEHRKTDLRYRLPYAYDVQLEQTMQPWIQVPDCDPLIKEPYVVLAAVPRYRCCRNFQALDMLKDNYRIIYIGHPQDYEAFGKPYGAEYFPVQGSIQAAQLIKGSQLFVGTQTLFTWLAEAMGVDRIVSMSPVFQDTHMRCTQGFKGAFLYPAELACMLKSWEYHKGRKPTVGYVIGTYGSPAYVDLQLALHVGKWKHDVVVSDDGSKNERLKEVCAKWNVPLIGVDDKRYGHQLGDRMAYKRGFDHFIDKDWMIKLSRRFVWLKDFQPTLDKYQHPLWKPCLSAWWEAKPELRGRALTTSCIAFHTGSMPQEVVDNISTMPCPNGYYMEKLVCYVLQQYYGSVPFALWDEIYTEPGRCITCKDVLWREKNTPSAYYTEAKKLGLQWEPKDFSDIITE